MLEITQHSSLWTSIISVWKLSMIFGRREGWFRIYWVCSWEHALRLDKIQEISCLTAFFSWLRRFKARSQMPYLRRTSHIWLVPAEIFPIALRAGINYFLFALWASLNKIGKNFSSINICNLSDFPSQILEIEFRQSFWMFSGSSPVSTALQK